METPDISLIKSIFSFIGSIFSNEYKISFRHFSEPNSWEESIYVHNRGQYELRLAGVGYIHFDGRITWLGNIRNAEEDRRAKLPCSIRPRSCLYLKANHNHYYWPSERVFGLCIQLDNGRTFIQYGNLPFSMRTKLRGRALLNRITSGSKGFDKVNPFEIRDPFQ